MALVTGTRLGPYEITAQIGAGGMGEVYRARDTRLARIVAIKTLPTELSIDPIRKQRFEREAKIISSLNHPGICALYDVGTQNGIEYLVMECIEGETLAKRLAKGPLPLDLVLRFGGQIPNPPEAYSSPFGLAIIYSHLRDGEKALANLEIAYGQGDEEMTKLAVEPQFDFLRSDPHFTDLEKRVGIPSQ